MSSQQNNGFQFERYGAIARSLPFATGKIFIVKAKTDPDYTDITYEFPPEDGINRVYGTFLEAALQTVTNRHDIIVCPVELVTTTGLAAAAPDAIIAQDASSANMGSQVIVRKTIVSGTITVAFQDLTSLAFGDFYINNIIAETDNTGLLGPTNFQIISTDTVGQPQVLVETVANLGPNKTVDLFSASVVKQRTILRNGKKLQFNGTVAPGVGLGAIYITAILEKERPWSFILGV